MFLFKRKNEKIVLKKYKNVNEAIGDLERIRKVDLKSNSTSIEDAVFFCKQVFTVLLGCEKLEFTTLEQKAFSQALKEAGCVSFVDAGPKFVFFKEPCDENEIKSKKDNILFPLMVFEKLTKRDYYEFQSEMDSILAGGQKGSTLTVWMDSQSSATHEKSK